MLKTSWIIQANIAQVLKVLLGKRAQNLEVVPLFGPRELINVGLPRGDGYLVVNSYAALLKVLPKGWSLHGDLLLADLGSYEVSLICLEWPKSVGSSINANSKPLAVDAFLREALTSATKGNPLHPTLTVAVCEKALEG